MFGPRAARKAGGGPPSVGGNPTPIRSANNQPVLLPFQARKSSQAQPTSLQAEWDALLQLIREAGSAVRTVEQRAVAIANQAEVVARGAVDELERAKQAAASATAGERAALERAEQAEDRAFQAEVRANHAEAKAAEAEALFAQVREALWAQVLNPHSEDREQGSAAA